MPHLTRERRPRSRTPFGGDSKILSSRISGRLVGEYLDEVRGLPNVFGGFPGPDTGRQGRGWDGSC